MIIKRGSKTMTRSKVVRSIVPMLLVVSLFLMGSVAAQEATCVDNDPDDNPFVKGRVSTDTKTIQGGVFWDSCKDSYTLIERTCEGDKLVTCDHGCADGICKSTGTAQKQSEMCTDSDPGDNVYFQGYTSQGRNAQAISWDYCMDGTTLYEQSCDGGKIIKCDTSCTQGKCNPHGVPSTQKQTQCIDTDSGKNFKVKGTVSYGPKISDILFDYCQSNTDLIEQTCAGPIKAICDRSCADGLCTGTGTATEIGAVKTTGPSLPQVEEPDVEETPAPNPKPTTPVPAAPTPEEGSRTLLWIVIIVVLIAIIYLSSTKGSSKKGKKK